MTTEPNFLNLTLGDDDTHISIDFETLGLDPSSIVMSVGLAVWSPCDPEPVCLFYEELDWQQQYEMGRTITLSTLKWWMEPEQIPHLPCKGIAPMKEVLPRLLAQINTCLEEGKLRQRNIHLWANGTNFDISILADLCRMYKQPVCWKYDIVKDIRTVRKLFDINPPTRGVKHNALDDAVWNLEVVGQLYKLGGKL